MTIPEMIAVMQAYEDGKEIEAKSKRGETWVRSPFAPAWDWSNYDYRVRPEPKYVPYDSVSEIDKNKWIGTKDGMAVYRIGAMDTCDDTIYLASYDNYYWIDLKELFEHYVYEDGSICGKRVSE